jgi:hypothetical protein
MGDPVIAAIIAGSAGLTGAFIGGCLSWIGAYINDQRNWRREDNRRYESERRETYSRFLGCVSRLINKNDPVSGGQINPKDALVADWFSALAEVELIASEEVRDAAFSFTKIVNDTLFNPQYSLDEDAWGNSRKRFVAAVRSELNIPNSGSPY